MSVILQTLSSKHKEHRNTSFKRRVMRDEASGYWEKKKAMSTSWVVTGLIRKRKIKEKLYDLKYRRLQVNKE